MKAILSHLSLTKLVPALLLFALIGCKTYSEEDKGTFDQQIEAYLKKTNWKPVRTESGLYVEQLAEGTGTEPIQQASIVKLNYKGTLFNGHIFDQTPPGKPLDGNVRDLIMGFRESLVGQTQGAKLRLIVPPHLGYGDMELEKIPANSILIFEVEVLSVK